MRLNDLRNTLVQRNTRANGKNENSDNKGPEIEFHTIAERVFRISRPTGPFHAVKKQNLITGIDN